MNARMNAEYAKWTTVISDCLGQAEREQVGSRSPVVDHEVVPSAAGNSDDITVWCICRNRAERQAFMDSERPRFISDVKKRLFSAGVPEATIDSIGFRFTSRDEVNASGGRFSVTM